MRYSENFQGLFSCQTQVLNPVNLSIAGFAEDASEAVGAIFCSSS